MTLGPRMIMDFKKMPPRAAMLIKAYKIPTLMTEGELDVHMAKDGFDFRTRSMIQALLRPTSDCNGDGTLRSSLSKAHS